MGRVDTNFADPSDELWYWMCDVGISKSKPEPLRTADLTKPWLYDRRFGVFYVDIGGHQCAMANIYARVSGYDNAFDMEDDTGIIAFRDQAEEYLKKTPGTAYMSGALFYSRGTIPSRAWSSRSLNDIEKDYFPDVIYLSNEK